MNKRRFTIKKDNGTYTFKNSSSIPLAFKKLGEYEDAEEQGLLLMGKCHCEKCIHHVRTDCGSTTIYCTKHECYMYEKNFCKDGEALEKMEEGEC